MDLLRTHRLDLAVVVMAVVVLVVTVPSPSTRAGGAVMALALLVLLARRRISVVAPVLAFALTAVALHLVPRAPAVVFLAVLVCFGVTGTLATRRDAVAGWLAGTAVVLGSLLTSRFTQGAGDVALTLTFCSIVWAAGLVATERGRQTASARAHAARVESQRDRDVEVATSHERARIAGDLHDIVSHGLSIVILQTVAARNALEDEPAVHDSVVDRRLAAVEETARAALEDMRRLLHLLGPDAAADGPGDGELTPSVGLDQLPALVEQARQAGQPVQVGSADLGAGLPQGLDAAAYRIVQEALTNALKHATGASTCVEVSRTPQQLTVSVRNGGVSAAPRAPQGAGFGLVGMRERTRLYGGSLHAEPEGRGFLVRATFPLEGSA